MTEQSANDGDQETYHGYSVDDENQPQGEGESLTDDRGLREPLDEGYSPPEHWSVGEGYGNTPLEEELGESLDQRIAQEVPEPDPYAQAAAEDLDSLMQDGIADEVGDQRSGRLVAPNEGPLGDIEQDLDAQDVGIDGAGASAEEAAVHLIAEDD